jgi:hypothetical protein
MNNKLIVLVIAVIFVSCLGIMFWPAKAITHEPGILCPDQPVQGEAVGVHSWQRDGYTYTPLATFSIRALVLHRKDYSDQGSDVAPVDFAVGWGAMSNQSVIDEFDISQTSRFYLWRAKQLPIPINEVTCSSTNIHIIPANDEVRDQIDDVCRGSIVNMSGYLVRVSGEEGFGWESSLSRTDTGNRACELLWVERLEIEKE